MVRRAPVVRSPLTVAFGRSMARTEIESMRSRWIGASGLLALAIVSTSLLGAATGRAADERNVTVAAECVRTIGSDTGLPAVRVTIENQSQLPLHIAYLQSFGSAPIGDEGPTGLKLDKPKRAKVIDVA